MLSKSSCMKDGTETKALFIKHLSKTDWAIIEKLKAHYRMRSVADVIRNALRLMEADTEDDANKPVACVVNDIKQ